MKTSLLFCAVLFLAMGLHAADKPLLAIPGKVLYENSFGSGPDSKFRSAKGKWEAGRNALRGSEKPEDNHGAVTRLPIKLQDFTIEYEFKFEGAKSTSLTVNDAKEHVARIMVTPAFIAIQKDDHDHDGPDKAIVFARFPVKLESGTWHKVRMEIVGDTMLGQVDDKTAWGSHELFKAEKASPGFTVGGQSVEFRNLKITEAKLNPDWDSVKSGLPKPGANVGPASAGKPGAKGKKPQSN